MPAGLTRASGDVATNCRVIGVSRNTVIGNDDCSNSRVFLTATNRKKEDPHGFEDWLRVFAIH